MLEPAHPVPDLLPRQDAILVGLEPAPAGANPHPWIPVQPSQAHLGFQQALADLPPTGGVLYVLPGSAPYVFGQTVTVDRPDCALVFQGGPRQGPLAGGSLLTFPASGGPSAMFRVTAPRVRFEGARVRHDATNDAGTGSSDDGRSVVRVDDADDAAFLGCTFDLRQANPAGAPDIVDFVALRALGASAAAPRAGLRLGGCTFLLRPGTRQAAGASAPGAHGVTVLRARHVADVQVVGCVFRGAQDAPRGASGPMILLEGCPGAVLCDLVFRALDLVPAAGATGEPVVRVAAHGPAEGHRSVLTRLSFEGLDARVGIELVDVRSDVLGPANFGRLLPHCEAAVSVTGADGRGLALGGVGFHNVSGSATSAGQNRMIDLQRVRDATLWGNRFDPSQASQAPLRIVDGECANVRVEAQQALSLP